ncbi:MAG: glycosyltransferase family 4 protein [Actinobacteria bacterium]|nr:glycosyltransferase family 4 protein [Actinomycetota bacterium]
MDRFKIFALASNHPDPINKYWGLYNKWSIEALTEKGIEVNAIIPRPYSPPFLKYSQIPSKELNGLYPKYYPRFWYLLPKRIFYGLSGESYSKHIGKYLKNNFSSPDLVHAFHIYLDGYGGLKYCKKYNIPLVVTANGTIEREISSWKNIKPKIIETLDYSSKILCVSNDLARIIEEMGIPKHKITTVPLGISLERFKPEKKMEIKRANGIENYKIILFVGQLTEKKGLKTLINASEIILKKYGDNIKFIIIGNGKFRKEIPKKDNILTMNNLSSEELADWFVAADIFTLPSLAEGRPTVIYEAMASECAVVATNVGGIPEQVKNGYNGFLVEPKKPNMLAEKIIYLLDNENEMIKMGKNGKKRIIEEGWTTGEYAKKTIDVYKKLF